MRIKFSRIRFESEAAIDVTHNRGFLISEPPFSDIDKTVKNFYGPRSTQFGTSFGDSNEFLERYRCKCGKYIGAAFEGETCPVCGTKIEYKDIDIMYTAYLNFGKWKLINPLFYQRMQSALSRKVLEDIISNENLITSQGVMRKHDDVIEVKKTSLKYHNIGLE